MEKTKVRAQDFIGCSRLIRGYRESLRHMVNDKSTEAEKEELYTEFIESKRETLKARERIQLQWIAQGLHRA